MKRHILGDIYQLGECEPGESGHEAVHAYALLNRGSPLLIDCGSHLHTRSIMADLDDLLGGRPPAYIFLTHSELPHAGNLRSVIGKWPHIHVLVSHVMLPYIEIAPVVPQGQVHVVAPGKVLELAGRKLVFLSALLKDQPGSHWIYDPETRCLFTGDGFGYYHEAGACRALSSEVEGGIRVEQFRAFHENAFRFLRWVLPDKLFTDLDALFARYPIEVIAPTHGNAIFEVDTHLARLKAAIREIHAGFEAAGQEG